MASPMSKKREASEALRDDHRKKLRAEASPGDSPGSHTSPHSLHSSLHKGAHTAYALDVVSDIKTRFLIISDTHAAEFSKDRQPLHEADVAIHCGDLTQGSNLEGLRSAIRLLKGLNAPIKLVIAGNHDFALDQSAYNNNFSHFPQDLVTQTYGHYGEVEQLFEEAKDAGIMSLEEGIHKLVLDNCALLKVYASPFTPSVGDLGLDWGFQYRLDGGHDFCIEEGVDVPITHGPPRGILDFNGKRAGCADLFRAIARSRPRLHCFGHIHKSWGAKLVTWRDQLSENPSHFDAINNNNSILIESLSGLTRSKFDTPKALQEKEEKRHQYVLERCCKISHCTEDPHPL